MQFLPAEWAQYGVDANGDGFKDPYNPADAIFAAARYLRAPGGDTNIRGRGLLLQPLAGVRRIGDAARAAARRHARRTARRDHRADRGALPRARRRRTSATASRPSRRRHGSRTHARRHDDLRPAGRARDRRAGRRGRADRRLARARALHLAARRLRQHLHLRAARRRRLASTRCSSRTSHSTRQRAHRRRAPRANRRRAAPRPPARSRARRSPKAPPSPGSRSARPPAWKRRPRAGADAPRRPPVAAARKAAATSRVFREGANDVYLHPLRRRRAGDRRHRARPRRRRRGAGGANAAAHRLPDPPRRGRRAADRPQADPRRLGRAREHLDLPREGREPVPRHLADDRPGAARVKAAARAAGAARRRHPPRPLRRARTCRTGRVDKRVLGDARVPVGLGAAARPSPGCAAQPTPAAAAPPTRRAARERDAVDITAVNGVPIAGHQGPGSIADATVRKLLMLQGLVAAASDREPDAATPAPPSRVASPNARDAIRVAFARPARRARAPPRARSSALAPERVDQADRAARRDPRPDGRRAALDARRSPTAPGDAAERRAVATTSPPSPPAASPPPPAGRRSGAPRARRGRGAASLAVGALALVVLIVACSLFGGSGGATYQLDIRRSRPARARRPGAGRRRAGRQRHRHRPDATTSRRDVTIHVDSSLTPLHEGHDRPGARALAVERRQPLHRALARAQQQARAVRGATLPASATQGSHRPRPAVQHAQPEDAQGAAGVHPGHRRTVRRRRARSSANRPNTSRRSLTATDHFFSELVRDQPTFTNFLVETAKAVTTIGARTGTARRPDRKREHDLHGDRLPAGAARRRACASCRSRCARATARSPNCPRRSPALEEARRRLAGRRRKPLTTLFDAPAPAA